MLRNSLPKLVTQIPGPKSAEIMEMRKENVADAVKSLAPVAIKRAEGAMVEDVDGNVFLDFIGGFGVLNVGHSHPEVVKAVQDQCEKFFAPNIGIFNYEQYPLLAKKLNEIVPIEGKKKTLLLNTGAEANENAIKIARKATGRSEIIAFAGGFHGRTYMAMALTSRVNPYKIGFGPFPSGVHRVPFPYCYRCPYALERETCNLHCAKVFEENIFLEYVAAEEVAAIILEPILGEGGFVVPPMEFIVELRRICDKYGIVLIADEVQSGFGRAGAMYATDHWPVKPDIVTSAKSFSGGIPVSAVTAKSDLLEACGPSQLGGTYCGNPLAVTSALKVIEIMERDDFAGKSNKIGDYCVKRLLEMKDKYEIIGDVRGKGAMIAVEFVKDRTTKEPDSKSTKAIIQGCLNKGLAVLHAGARDNSIRFLMPLVLTDEQLEVGLNILDEVIGEVNR